MKQIAQGKLCKENHKQQIIKNKFYKAKTGCSMQIAQNKLHKTNGTH